MNKYLDCLNKYNFINVSDFIASLEDIQHISAIYLTHENQQDVIHSAIDAGISDVHTLKDLLVSYQLAIEDRELAVRDILIEKFKVFLFETYNKTLNRELHNWIVDKINFKYHFSHGGSALYDIVQEYKKYYDRGIEFISIICPHNKC